MGARGSSLVGKAVVHEKLMPYTSFGKQAILEMRLRHLHDLGGRFALGRRQFASLLQENEDGDNIHILFDTDKNGLVDALEVIAALTMLSSMTIQDKIDIIHSLYDFNGTGSITVDEMTILLRTVASGGGKMDNCIITPTTRQVEELAKWAFRKAEVDIDGEITKSEFDDFCLTNPTVRSFLEFWTGASNQVALSRNELWTDLNYFPPNGSSIYFSLCDAPDGMPPSNTIRWLRPKQFCLGGKPKLYSDGGLGKTLGNGGFGGIKQGQMANLWFLNALSLVASRPNLLRSLFVWTGQESHGRFAIRFFKEERWINVVIDDFIPCDPMGSPLFATSSDPTELWPLLIEKAYAKLHHCYQALIHGCVEYALRDLTGATVERLSLTNSNNEGSGAKEWMENFWQKLSSWVNDPDQHIVGCMWSKPTPASVQQGGTLEGIQFAVMHTIVATCEYKQFRLVRIRNPWGVSNFHGDWSNGSEVWAKAPAGLVAAAVAASGGVQPPSGDPLSPYGGTSDPTCTWFAVDDVVRLFDHLIVAHLFTEDAGWSHQFRRIVFPATGGGCPNDTSWIDNPQYYLDVKETSQIQTSLTQWDARYHGSRVLRNEPFCLGLLLHQFDWGHDITCVKPLEAIYNNTPNSTAHENSNSQNHSQHTSSINPNQDQGGYLVARTEPFHKYRSVSFSEVITLEPGKYVLIPMTYDPVHQTQSQASRQCWLSFFSKSPLYPIKLYSDAEVEYDDPNREIEGTCSDIEFSEDLAIIPNDEETPNETVALASLAELISKMWTIARQLQFRKLDLEEKVVYLEEEKRRADEEAFEAAAGESGGED